MLKLEDLKIAIYADGADIDGMMEQRKKPYIKGFTTNPTLMKKAGVKDYFAFAGEALKYIRDVPVSFEVFGDDLVTMEKEARKLSSLAENVYVKIPVMNSKKQPTYELVRKLSEDGIHLNVTAVFTQEQVKSVVDALSGEVESIVSVFAGRIADAGIDAREHMKKAAEICHSKKNTLLLWASSREVYNMIEAQESGADIITVTNDLINKADKSLGTDLFEYSHDTVEMFLNDGKALGFSIL